MFRILFDFIIALCLCLSIAPSQAVDAEKLPCAHCRNITQNVENYEAHGNVEISLDNQGLTDTPPGYKDALPAVNLSYSRADDNTCKDIHVPDEKLTMPLDPIHSSFEGEILPEHQCKCCNINLPPSSAPGVLIKCHNCTEPNSGGKQKT